MNHAVCRRLGTLACALLAIHAAGPAQAAALYETTWGWKWGMGSIVYDASVPDSNPNPHRGAFVGAIVGYDLLGWEMANPTHLVGSTGSIWVNAPTTQCSDPTRFDCDRLVMTYQFGAATAPDPAAWQISISFPRDVDDPTDALPLDFVVTDLWAMLEKPSDGLQLLAISPMTTVRNTQIPTPVPEPGSWLLVAAGLAAITARRRRCSDPQPPGG